MFNFAADQLFVVQPRNTGGGILSLLLSFDTLCAGINFQNISTQEKLLQWKQHLNNTVVNAHMHGHINFCSPVHNELIHSADSSDRYVHKLHFHELLSEDSKNLLIQITGKKYVHKLHFHELLSEDSKNLLIQITGKKNSVGIYLTEDCAEKLMQLRPHTDSIDYYQLWVYNNQKKLLLDYFDIESMHTLSFSDMLDANLFMDHLKYCEQCLKLDLDQDLCYQVINDWLDIIKQRQ